MNAQHDSLEGFFSSLKRVFDQPNHAGCSLLSRFVVSRLCCGVQNLGSGEWLEPAGPAVRVSPETQRVGP